MAMAELRVHAHFAKELVEQGKGGLKKVEEREFQTISPGTWAL